MLRKQEKKKKVQVKDTIDLLEQISGLIIVALLNNKNNIQDEEWVVNGITFWYIIVVYIFKSNNIK